tara:strand:- start:2546 stop:2938 length:393 start_codon:yes stop_codon:yes gene_type:complete
MPGSKYSEKQMKIARVAEPRDAITGADFEAMNNSKMGGGMIKYSEGGDIRKEMLTQMLEDARESGDDDKIIEIEAELFQMGDGEGMMMGGMVKKPRGYRHGGSAKVMSTNPSKGKGCGIAVSGKGYSGTY